MIRRLPGDRCIIGSAVAYTPYWEVFSHINGVKRRDTYVKQSDGESPNDRNDRAIRVAAAWYTKSVPGVEVLLLTNDADNRRKALAEGIRAMSIQARPIGF